MAYQNPRPPQRRGQQPLQRRAQPMSGPPRVAQQAYPPPCATPLNSLYAVKDPWRGEGRGGGSPWSDFAEIQARAGQRLLHPEVKKKLTTLIVSALVLLVNDVLELGIERETIAWLVGLVATYMVGQGLADMGKEQAIIQARTGIARHMEIDYDVEYEELSGGRGEREQGGYGPDNAYASHWAPGQSFYHEGSRYGPGAQAGGPGAQGADSLSTMSGGFGHE